MEVIGDNIWWWALYWASCFALGVFLGWFVISPWLVGRGKW